MKYRQLTIETVPDYLRTLPEMLSVFSSFEDLEIKEIGDGNLNFVFIAKNLLAPHETAILKQAVPFLRVVGDAWPLPRERMDSEVRALRYHFDLCPDMVPKIYYASSDMSVVIMEDLNAYKILRGEIINGKTFPKFAEHISTFLAQTLFHSSDLYLAHDVKKEKVEEAINIELCKITEDLVFTHPYEDNKANAYSPELPQASIDQIQRDPAVRAAVGEMKFAFMTHAEALLHGDLHSGSAMVNAEETYIIDPEFCFYGPIGFDVGAVLGNLYLAYFSQDYHQHVQGNDPSAYRTWLLKIAEDIWTLFDAKFRKLWVAHDSTSNAPFLGQDLNGDAGQAFRDAFMKRLLSDAVGFAACKMMRRIVGLAKVSDIADIPDLKARAKAEINGLKMGAKMVVERDTYASIAELSSLAKSISPLSGTYEVGP